MTLAMVALLTVLAGPFQHPVFATPPQRSVHAVRPQRSVHAVPPQQVVHATLPQQVVLATLPQQVVLDQAVQRFAGAWIEKDTPLLRSFLAQDGIRLRLPDEEHQLLRPRQAQAAFDTYLGKYEGGAAEVRMVSIAEGNPDRGFAELRWRTRSPGLSDPVILTLFLAYAREGERWVVTEIRILF
jgi:hypothetical protein